MNFEFSEEQELLRDQARGFLSANCGTQVVRNVLEGEKAYDKELWKKVADMGWTATVIPEEYGGLGLSYLELVVIAEEIGRAMAPIPFSSSVYLASEAILTYGSEEQKLAWLPKLASGEAIGAFAVSEGQGQASPASLKTNFSGGTLEGTKVPVADGEIANLLIVTAKSGGATKPESVSLYIVDLSQDCIEKNSVRTLDPSRAQASISFNGANAERLGVEGSGWAQLQNIYDRAAVLFAWEQVGGSDAALEMAKDYAMGRFAFGRAIASYQAIKHKLANMYVKNTLARSNCYYGAWALSTNAPELPLAAATARVASIQAYYFASKENIQTHGGMGYTWEFDCHFHYRRAKLLSLNIGSESTWQEKLVTALEQQNAA
jgi:alkylation response protein AidB-like acyl-CoA dehydrogenase